MTEEELKDFRVSVRILAIESLFVAQISNRLQSEAGRKEQCRELDLWVQSLQPMAFPELPSEQSDLYASEFQHAVESLVSLIKSRLQRPRGE